MDMKKIILGLAVFSAFTFSCREDDAVAERKEESAAVQNEYDDLAAQQFLKDNYLDARGNIVAFSTTSTADDAEKPLAELNPVKLPSGVIYIVRYIPQNGKSIGATDKISIMHRTTTYIASKEENTVKFSDAVIFRNTISGTGFPEVDPTYYYVKQNVLDADKTKTRSYYEIEGFQEGLKNFLSTEAAPADNYNLQGVIIVPSRAAFAKDPHFFYTGFSLKDRSFVFNFQIYKTEPR